MCCYMRIIATRKDTRNGLFSLSTAITLLLRWPQGIYYCRYKFQINSDPTKSQTIGVVKFRS